MFYNYSWFPKSKKKKKKFMFDFIKYWRKKKILFDFIIKKYEIKLNIIKVSWKFKYFKLFYS